MAILRPITDAQMRWLSVKCLCGWRGKAGACVGGPHEPLLCPHCLAPVEQAGEDLSDINAMLERIRK